MIFYLYSSLYHLISFNKEEKTTLIPELIILNTIENIYFL